MLGPAQNRVSPPTTNTKSTPTEVPPTASDAYLEPGTAAPALKRAPSSLGTAGYRGASHNVPVLDHPEADVSDFIEICRNLQMTLSITDMNKAVVNANFIQSELDNARKNEASNSAAVRAKNDEIEAKTNAQQTMSWVLCGIGIALALLGLFTAGSGLALGIAIFGAILAALDLATNILHECEATRINEFGEKEPINVSINGLVSMLIEGFVALGWIKVIGINADANTPGARTRESYEQMKSDVSIGVTVFMLVATIVISVLSIFRSGGKIAAVAENAADAADTTADAAKATTNVAQKSAIANTGVALLGSGAALVSGLGALGNSILSFIMAFDRNDVRTMQITAKQLEGIIQSLQQQFDINQENFRLAMNFQETLRKRIADAMADFNEGSVTIAKNIR